MIATILPSSSNFHAVAYNENKVAKGDAILLEIKNFGAINTLGYEKPEDLIRFLKKYSSKNPRVKNPQVHMSFSCKGREMSHQELLEFAHKYLKEMGYDDPKQPLLVYAHTDTENNHIHIITSKINPFGKRISDSYEKVKSQQIIDKLLNEKREEKVKENIAEAKKYNFRSVSQFRAILESMGYECYEKSGKLNVKKGGVVIASENIPEIEKMAEENDKLFEEPNYNQLFGLFVKYRDLNTDIEGLKKDLRKKFGIDLVFFGRKDSPYGFAIVDYNNKMVIEGSKVMSVKRLFQFQSKEERFNKIDSFILNCIKDNPDITTNELNQKLKRVNARLRKDTLYYGKQKKKIDSFVFETLDINNKMEWIKSFKPKSEYEFAALAKIVKLDLNEIEIPQNFSKSVYEPEVVISLKNIVSSSNNLTEIRNKLRDSGYTLLYNESKYFAYNRETKTIIDFDRANIKINKSIPLDSKNPNIKQISNKNPGIYDKGVERGINREWEVGSNGYEDDIDNGKSLKL